jgi:RNA polymerase sigma-70 factor, ECF subfamily
MPAGAEPRCSYGNPGRRAGHDKIVSMATVGPQPRDQALWLRVAEGEPEAFGELFDLHAGTVYSYLAVRLGDWSAAEDLTSAVFLQAWRRRTEVVFERASALPWLLGVANGLMRNEARARRRRTELLDRVRAARGGVPGVPGVEADHADAVADRVDGERRAATLRAAVGRLPRREREVIELCVWAGLDNAAAAIALGVRPGTVKSRLHRARRSLAAELGAEETP